MYKRQAAKTAVFAGTTAAVGGAVHHRQQKKWAQQEYEQQQAMQQEMIQQQVEQEQYETPVEQAPAVDLTAQLQQLAQLHESGVLSDEEFAAAKQRLLAG